MITCPKCNTELTDLFCKHCSISYAVNDKIISFISNTENNLDDYKPEGLDKLYNYEKINFWFKNRMKLIRTVFKKFIKKNSHILEVGAGTGYVAENLINAGFTDYSIGELHLNGLLYAQKRGLTNLYQFDLYDPPFNDEFDVVAMFDVIEHIENDGKIIQNIGTILKSKGKLVLTVPAHMFLWSKIDDISGHKKRYNIKTISDLLKQNGFKVRYITHFNLTILPFLMIRSFLSKNDYKESNSGLKISTISNTLFNILCTIDRIFLKLFKLPAGGSIIAVAEKG